MTAAILAPRAAATPDPAKRGYFAVYRDNESNYCPGCGRSHWWVGRVMAECGFCGTALPILAPSTGGAGLFRHSRGRHEVSL